MDYHSCDFCRSMVIDPERKTIPSGDRAPGDIFFFEPRLDSLLSAVHTCPLAQWLHRNWSVSADTPCDWDQASSRSGEIHLCADTISYTFDRFPIVEFLWIGLWDPVEDFDEEKGRCRTQSRGWLDVFAEPDDPAAPYFSTRPINSKIGSPENFKRARGWVEECLAKHEICPKLELKFMPKTVLKVSKAENDAYQVALHFPSSPQPYLALSYCWGGDQPHKTTQARIDSGNMVLDWDVLPASIQDAVKVTVGMGFSYLWIDSLCIVQDDEVEKAKQIALMPQIYTSAVVTIMASRSNRAVDGFLHDIDFMSVASMAVKLPFRRPGSHSVDGTVVLTNLKEAGMPEPIDYRGWTLQERYLAPRLLEYTTKQLSWTCGFVGEKKGYKDGWKTGPKQDDLGLHPSGSFWEEMYVETRRRDKRDVYNGMIVAWRVLVQIYTRRTLSFTRDRILAVSGIAEVFSRVLEQEYFAGHWKGTLPYDLLWSVVPGKAQNRPDEYQAPSWSWASINSEVKFNYARACCPSESAPPDPVVFDLRTQTDIQEPTARFGFVNSGVVTGRGAIRRARWFGNQDTPDHYHVLHDVGSRRMEGAIPLLRMIPDACETEFVPGKSGTDASLEVHLLHLGACRGLGLRGLAGLVLREIPVQNGDDRRRFTRLGIFHLSRFFANRTRKSLGTPRRSDLGVVGDGQDYFHGCVLEKFEIV